MTLDAEWDSYSGKVKCFEAADHAGGTPLYQLSGSLSEEIPLESVKINADDVLTERQSEIALLVSTGFTNKEVARILEISPSTVKNHITTILFKLKINRRGKIHVALRG